MNFEKALRILGLNSNFTEEELKKAHRALVNKYHPDRNKDPEAEDKMKEINEAREFLVKHLKTGNRPFERNNSQYTQNTSNYNNNRYDNDIARYTMKKYFELLDIIDLKFDEYQLSETIRYIIAKIKYTLDDFDYQTKRANNKQKIDEAFENTLRKIKVYFKELKTKFYRENNIIESDVKETINYDCTLREFYKQLLKIRDKYGKEPIIKKLLEKEIEKYKTYAGYDEISDRIEIYINDIFSKIKNNGFNYIQKDIDDMHIEIEQIFKTYYSLLKKISELESIVNTIENQEIKNYYKVIERNFYGGIPYSEFDEHIKELEEMIDKYNKENQKKIDFKKNEQQINQIYQSLITRYSDETKKYNIIMAEQSQFDIQLNLLKELLELFTKGCQEFKDLDYFNLFNEITFTDIENDNKIKEIIVKNSKPNNSRTTKSKIYINIKDATIMGSESFYYLDEEKHQIYKVRYSDSSYAYLEIKNYELGDEYITLDEFLDKATFVDENIESPRYKIYGAIYKMDNYLLCITSNKFCIRNMAYGSLYSMTKTKKYINLDEFKDKKHLIGLIEKQIEQTIKEKEQQSQQSIPHSHEYYSSYINNNKNFYKKVFDEPQLNTDDTYGYNTSKKRR